jgi:hypothetical protein
MFAFAFILMFVIQKIIGFGTIKQLMQSNVYVSASDKSLEAHKYVLANHTLEGLSNSTNFLHARTLMSCKGWERFP